MTSAKLILLRHNSSIVASNEHLRNELIETKQRHMSEIDQLKWTYKQLRTTQDQYNNTKKKYNGVNGGSHYSDDDEL